MREEKMNKNTPKQELVLDKTYNQQNLEIYLPECIILVGLSGCGKSTFAKKLQGTELDKNKKAYSILNGDEIREELTGDINNQEHNEEVFKLLHRRIKDNLKAKNSIIIDATNLKLKNRRSYLNCIKKIPCVKKIYIFAVPREVCEENQNKRIAKQVNEIIAMIVLIIYLGISFITFAWHITWIIWVVYGIIEQIVKLIFELRSIDDEK